MACRAFFEQHATSDVSKELQKLDLATQLDWEAQTASRHSPGPVEDTEELTRHWLSPIHYDTQTAKLKPTAFDDAANKGLSTNRLAHCPLGEQHAAAAARVANHTRNNGAERSLIGYSIFKVAEARSILTAQPPPRRALGVYDTALADNTAHADVCQIASNAQGGRSARTQMRELLNDRLQKL